MLEILEDTHPLDLWCASVNVGLAELDSIRLQGIYIVRKHNDLVTATFVVVDEVLCRLELGRIHAVQ